MLVPRPRSFTVFFPWLVSIDLTSPRPLIAGFTRTEGEVMAVGPALFPNGFLPTAARQVSPE